MVFDLEGQVSQHVSSQSVAPRQGESLADTSNGFNAYEMAEVENHTNKAASKHMETQHVGQHGTSEYYQQLVKRALMDGKLDVHALSFDFLHRLVLLDHQKKLAGYFCEVVNDSTTTEAKLFEISKSLHEYSMLPYICQSNLGLLSHSKAISLTLQYRKLIS
jgi:hypothetical protein